MKTAALLIILITLIVSGSLYFTLFVPGNEDVISPVQNLTQPANFAQPSENKQFVPSPLSPPPVTKIIPMKKHLVQTFNNCGPATLAMQLSYFGDDVGQDELGRKLRPYQIPNGDNDDKTVFLSELAREAVSRGYYAVLRPNGNVELIRQFISWDIPVILITWLNDKEDIGHYRIIRGYDDTTQKITQDDSYQGKNLTFSYSELNNLWQPFNYQYLVIVPPDKKPIVDLILNEQQDEAIAWKNALARSLEETSQNDSPYPVFNSSVASYYLGNYTDSISIFESIRSKLPPRMLWYQIEPIKAYLELKNYSKVFELTDQILSNNNRAFSELYLLRAKAYNQRGETLQANKELELARMYNINTEFSLD